MNILRMLRRRTLIFVHEQDRKAFCPNCGPIHRITMRKNAFSSRSMFFCPSCNVRATLRLPKKKR